MVPQVCVGVLIQRERKILLVRRRGAHGAGTWGPPGGHLEFGETPAACAVREVREEVGVEIGPARFRAVTNDVFVGEGIHYLIVWLEADLAAGEPRVASARELTEVGWFGWNELPSPLFLSLANLVEGRGLVPD